MIRRADDDPLLSPAAASEYLGVGQTTVYRLIEEGRIEVVRLPGSGKRGIPRIRRSVLNELIDRQSRKPVRRTA